MANLWQRLFRHWLSRGEALAAPASLGIVVILCAAMGAGGWWAVYRQRNVVAEARQAEITAVAGTIGTAAELMISSNQLSALRRLMIESGREYELEQCRVVLPDGSIIADQDPRQIDQAAMPQPWPSGAARKYDEARAENQLTITTPLQVPQRGLASLIIAAGPRPTLGQAWLMQAGVGTVGVGSLVALLIVLRNLRARLRSLGEIDESLIDFKHGENRGEALRIDPTNGPSAEAWNALLDQRGQRQEIELGERTRQVLTKPTAAQGELTHACNALAQGLVVFDQQLTITYLNGAAAVFLGGKRDELSGESLGGLKVSDAVAQAVRQAVNGSSRQRRTIETEPEQTGRDHVLRFAIRPITRGETPAAAIVIEDITQQRVAEQSRHSFISQATHELRTPLTNIRLYLDNALESGEQDAELRGQCLNVIGQESRRLEQLVDDMLNVSQIEAGSISLEYGDLRLDAMFEELRSNYEATASDRQITFSVNLPPKLPVIQADRKRLTVALQNLIGNAIKYTPDQGTVEITVETSTDHLAVEVKDTGIGISEEDAAKIFDKFYRAQNKQTREITGTGLGLALAREIVRLHGGDITVDSEPNEGSSFTLSLPIEVQEG